MSEVARIFVGCDPNDCDLEQMMVLEYSLRKHASIPVEIHWMQMSRDPDSPWHSDPAGVSSAEPFAGSSAGSSAGASSNAAPALGWHTERWVTPFSGFRWAIPELCDFKGRAIYMDADMIVLRDIADLWRMPMGPGKVMAAKGRKQRWRFCVTVWDCAAAQAHLPSLNDLKASPAAHAERSRYFSEHPELITPLDGNDNNVDGENQPVENIRILHYSDIGTQFSHRYAIDRLTAEGAKHWFEGEVLPHPRRDLQALFDRYYSEALAAGYTLDQYRVARLYGPMVKANQANYTGNKATRKVSVWSRLKLRLRSHQHARDTEQTAK